MSVSGPWHFSLGTCQAIIIKYYFNRHALFSALSSGTELTFWEVTFAKHPPRTPQSIQGMGWNGITLSDQSNPQQIQGYFPTSQCPFVICIPPTMSLFVYANLISRHSWIHSPNWNHPPSHPPQHRIYYFNESQNRFIVMMTFKMCNDKFRLEMINSPNGEPFKDWRYNVLRTQICCCCWLRLRFLTLITFIS